MQGFDAITANNGWAMAYIGALIVMCGLAVLSFIISQLNRIVTFFEKKDVPPEPVHESTYAELELEPEPEPVFDEKEILHNLTSAAKQYRLLCADLGETFELTKLYEVFNKNNLPHPHITIRSFREAGILTPMGEGFFSWGNMEYLGPLSKSFTF